MIEINILEFIPQEIRQQAQDALVDFVSEQAKKFVSDGVADKLKQLRSDGGFRRQFDKGLDRALKRFAEEYYEKDEDLVDAIVQEKDLFKNPEVKQALMTMLKSPGSYLADEGDVVAQTFDSVLPGRKNRERVNKAMMYLLRCLVEELWHLPELQPVYSLQFQKITAEAMKQQVELQKVQLQALVGVNEGVRQALLQLADAIGEKKLLSSGNTIQERKPEVIHNLPQPDYGKFIGREDEFKEIINELQPYPESQHAVISIDGIGGIGKSTLALAVAHYYLEQHDQIPEKARFDAIIWVSAKQTVLTADGIISRPQALRTLDDIFSTIAICLQREDIIQSAPEHQKEKACAALRKQRTLLILDNLETVDDEQVKAFLRELPAPTKAIITTRYRIDITVPIRLTALKQEEVYSLIENECNKRRTSLTSDEKTQLFQRTGGIPLAIVWTIAQIGMGRSIPAVFKRLGEPNSDIVKFCFVASIEIIRAKPAYRLFLALSLFAASASREALGIITGLDKNTLDRDDGLANLETLSLVNNLNGRFSMLPLTKLLASDLFMKDNDECNLTQNWKRWLVDYVHQYGGEDWDARGFRQIDHEIDNILAFIETGLENEWLEALVVQRFTTYYMKISGRWTESNRQAVAGLELAKKMHNQEAIVMLSSQSLGWTLAQQGKLADAEKYAREGLDAAQKTKISKLIVYSMRVLGQIRRKQNYLDESEKIYKEALELVEHIENSDGLKGNLIGELGKIALAQDRLEDARELFSQATDYLSKNESDKIVFAAIIGHMAKLYLKMNDLSEAEKLSLKCIEIFKELDGVTDNYYVLGQIYLRQGRKQDAIDALNYAILEFERLGMEPELLASQELLETIN